MRSTLLSLAFAASVAPLPGTESSAFAQSRRGGTSASVQFSTQRGNVRGGVYYGPSRYYSAPRSSYYDRYYSAPRWSYYDRSYYSTPRYSYYYDAPSTSRYSYYWSGGYHICYDRTSGAYWYEQGGYWYRWY